MEHTLKIFITQDCPNCAETLLIVHHIRQDHPHLSIEIIDIADQQATVPEAIFATPTFMLDNRVVSLGNPKLRDVARWLKEAGRQQV